MKNLGTFTIMVLAVAFVHCDDSGETNASTGGADSGISGSSAGAGTGGAAAAGAGGGNAGMAGDAPDGSAPKPCEDGVTAQTLIGLGSETHLNGEPLDTVYCNGGDDSKGRIDRIGPKLCPDDISDLSCGEGPCAHECADDDSCGAGESCMCAMAIPGGAGIGPGIYGASSQCMPSECQSTADCAGFSCSFSREKCGEPWGFYCRTPYDECNDDSDCGGPKCRWYANKGHWACSDVTSCENY